MPNIVESFDSLEAFRASEREALAPFLNADGSMGAIARAASVSAGFNDWCIAEVRRGIAAEHLSQAASFLVASMIHDLAVNVSADKKLKLELVASILLQQTTVQVETLVADNDGIPIWPVAVAPAEEGRS